VGLPLGLQNEHLRRLTILIMGVKMEQGEHIALQQQIQMFMERRAVLEQMMGVEAAHDLIANSVMYISIGGNEYIHNYITNGSESSLTPEDFTDLVLASLSVRIMVKESVSN
jgi:hypothetical protein